MSDEANTISGAVWDDALLVKTYDESVGLAREALARRLADSTNKRDEAAEEAAQDENVEPSEGQVEYEPVDFDTVPFKVGDYARATYSDGIDYEGCVVSINKAAGTCVIRYLGYGNEQQVPLGELLPSWGRQARREQFMYAKEDEKETVPVASSAAKPSTSSKKVSVKTVAAGERSRAVGTGGGSVAASVPVMPPMPLIPPMFASQADGGEQDFVAMLTAWYMSGYYTGLYQGKKEATAAANANANASTSGSAKKRVPKK
ncbi:hypothetical protein KR018_009047 [Drosophila ironensis]|nr:hypothetical protein KR018_009047 [Drosophila ironensis]